MPEQSIDIQFTLNGEPHQLSVDPKRAALSVLREELGVRSLTAGCSPQGICGCCTAIINGKPRLTCTLRAKSLNGKEIETHDSFSEAEQAAVTTAFAATGATQCGYCTPGIATQAICLLRNVPEPDETIIDKALNQHVCRCTGWTRIREAIKLTGQLLAGAEPTLPGGLSTPTTAAAVLGRRTRIEDMTRPGMVHVAPCFAPHARCRVTAIDIPDGITALTAADIPGAVVVGGQPLLIALGAETRCAADVIALAVGDSAEAARAAAASITITAEPLELVLHPEAGEIIAEHHITRGTPPAPATVAHTASATVSTAAADPAFLEPDAAMAVPMAEGVVRVYSPSQDP
ncbi:MAG: aerobic-type carbon monoxide dehydrogenase small subunit (CoxS/CutS family), partial [Myxococcota bacterium]